MFSEDWCVYFILQILETADLVNGWHQLLSSSAGLGHEVALLSTAIPCSVLCTTWPEVRIPQVVEDMGLCFRRTA